MDLAHVDKKKKDILILCEGPTQGLDDTIRTGEKTYSIKFTEFRKKKFLSLRYNGANSCLFVNRVEIHKFKAKDSEVNAIPLCLGNVSKDFSVDNMKTGLNEYVYDFSVDYNAIAVGNILDIHNYLMEKHGIV